MRDPRKTSTFGFGQLLDAARKSGARIIIAGIGSSATNDANGVCGRDTANSAATRNAKGNRAHNRANRAALDYLQAWAGITRTGYTASVSGVTYLFASVFLGLVAVRCGMMLARWK